MPSVIEYANGDKHLVDEDPKEVLEAIQMADEFGPLTLASFGPQPIYISVAQIRSISKT